MELLDEVDPLTLDDPETETLEEEVLTIPLPLEVDVTDEVGTLALDVGVKEPVPDMVIEVLVPFE